MGDIFIVRDYDINFADFGRRSHPGKKEKLRLSRFDFPKKPEIPITDSIKDTTIKTRLLFVFIAAKPIKIVSKT